MSNDESLHTKDGKLTSEGFKALQAYLNGPAMHQTVDMNINKFKKYVDTFPLTKGQRSQVIKDYKTKAWEEYKEIVQHKGTFPTHSVVEITKDNDSGKSEE